MEIYILFGDIVCIRIKKNLAAKFYSVIAGEATDLANDEQISINI